jgi:uroporphyrinogen-III synthase
VLQSVSIHAVSSATSDQLRAHSNQNDPLKQLQEHLTEQLQQSQKLIAANEGDHDPNSNLDDAEVRAGNMTDE